MYLIMKRETILSAIAAVAMVPVVEAQAPELTPLPEGVILTSSVRVEEGMGELPVPGVMAQVDPSGELTASVAPGCPNPACTCGSDCSCTPGNVCSSTPPAPAPSVTVVQTPVSPAPAPAPAPEVAPAPAVAPAPEVSPAPAPAAAPAPVPAPVVAPAPGRPGCCKGARSGKKMKRVRKVVRLMPGDMPPCGKPRPFGAPVPGTVPPCVRRHGKVMPAAPAPTVAMPEGSCTIVYPAPTSAPAASPQAVRVIINGVETLIPLVDGGVNITIKPL